MARSDWDHIQQPHSWQKGLIFRYSDLSPRPFSGSVEEQGQKNSHASKSNILFPEPQPSRGLSATTDGQRWLAFLRQWVPSLWMCQSTSWVTTCEGAPRERLWWAGSWNRWSRRLLSSLRCWNLNFGNNLRIRVVLNRALILSKEKTRNIGIVAGIQEGGGNVLVVSQFLNRTRHGYYRYYYRGTSRPHLTFGRGVLGGEKMSFCFWSLLCQLEIAIFLQKGIVSIWVCPEWWQNATWKLSQNRLWKHSKHFHSFWSMPRKDSPSSPLTLTHHT